MPRQALGLAALGVGGKGQNATAPFVGAYDAIASLVHVYEPARRTLSAYTGNLLRLRRDSDDGESDFTYVSDADPELNLAAIAAWAGGASYIVSIYDQKTGDTITQATKANQPLFVANIKNGHAGFAFDGSNHYMQGTFTTGGALSQPFSLYGVAQLDATVVGDSAFHIWLSSIVSDNLLFLGQRSTNNWIQYLGSYLGGGASDANWELWSALGNGASSQFWLNDVSEAGPGNSGGNNPAGITIGAGYNGNNKWKGPISSVVIADPSHSDAQRAAMQTAMNNYWTVY